MSAFWRKHPIFKWTAMSVIGLFAAIVIVASVAEWNALRRPMLALNLERDASGRASWEAPTGSQQLADASPHWPAIQRLIIRDGKICGG
jgi:hypothetical protein